MGRLRTGLAHRTASLAIAVALTACAGVSASAPSAPPSAAGSINPASATPAAVAELVDIGGRSLYLSCQGEGSPTIILEAGLTGDHRTWERVQPALAGSTRVCAYDRANIAPSDPAATPRTAADAVDDLHLLLEAAGVERPVVLLGFSMGGLISQLYASTYPDDVNGLVLVESNHPDEFDQFSEHLTQEQIEADREFVLGNSEGLDPFASFVEAQEAGPLPEVPLIVITARNATGDWPPDWDAELFDRLRAEQQADLATLVAGGRQVFADESGHHVPSEQPEVIIESVEAVLEELRAS